MGKIREVRELVLYHWKALAGFEIMYKFASGLVFVPLFWGMFDLIMKSTGYSYLSLENIFAFLANPCVFVLLVGLSLLLLAATAMTALMMKWLYAFHYYTILRLFQ